MTESVLTAHEVSANGGHLEKSADDSDRTVKAEDVDVEAAVEVAEDVLDSLGDLGVAESGYYSNKPIETAAVDAPTPNQHQSMNNASTDESYRTALSDLSLNMVTAENTLNHNSAAEDSDNVSVSSTGGRRRKRDKVRLAAAAAAATGAASLRQIAAPMSLLGAAFKGTGSSSCIVEGQKLPEDVDDGLSSAASVMEWDYGDFVQADHRLKLYCELTLCEEAEETVLLLTRVRVLVKSSDKMFPGVVAVTNRKIYVLRITKAET